MLPPQVYLGVHRGVIVGVVAEGRVRAADQDTVGDMVVAGAREAAVPAEDEDPAALYSRLTADGQTTRREAVKAVARRLGLPAREVYRRVLEAEKGTPSAG